MENFGRLKYIIFFLFLFFGSVLVGQETGGTLPSLMGFGVGGQANSLGNSFVAVADDPTAIYWNPAGLEQIRQREISLQFLNNFISSLNIIHTAYVHPMAGNNSIGLSLFYFSISDLVKYGTSKDKLGSFNSKQYLLSFAYSRSFVKKYYFGATAKLLSQNINDINANTVDLDIGALIKPIPMLSIGLNVKNLLPLSYSFEQIKADIPPNVFMGFKLNFLKNKFFLTGDVNKIILSDFNASTINWGAGIGYNIFDYLRLMVGIHNMNFSAGIGAMVKDMQIYTSFMQNSFNNGDFQISLLYKLKDTGSTKKELDYFYRGTVLYNNHDYRNAIKYFEKVLEIRNDPTAQYYLDNAKKYMQSEEWMSDEEKQLIKYNLKRAKKFEDKNDIGGAIQAYRDVLNVNSENEEALKNIERLKKEVAANVRTLYNEGLAYYKMKKYKEALNKSKEALSLDPEHKPSISLKEKCEAVLKDILAEEQKREQQVIEAKTLFREGLKNFKAEKWAEAIANFQKSLDIVGDDTDTIEYLQKARNNLKASRSEADRKKDAEHYFKIGMAFYQSKKLKKAITEFEKAVNTYPDYKEAAQYLEQAQSEYNAMINTPLEQGKTYLRENKLGDAIASFEKVLKIDSDNSIAKEYLEKAKSMIKDAVVLYNKQGDKLYKEAKYPEALQSYRQTLLISPDNSAAQAGVKKCRSKLKERIDKIFDVAMEQYNQKEYRKAIQNFGEVLKLDPDHQTAKDFLEKSKKLFEKNKVVIIQRENYNNGEDYFRNRNFSKAKDFFQKVIDINDKNTMAKKAIDYIKRCDEELKKTKSEEEIAKKFTQGIMAFKKRKYDDAIQIWQEIKKLDPENKFVDKYIEYAKKAQDERGNKNYQDGLSAYKTGDYLKAQKFFKKALEVNPNLKKAKMYLSKVNTYIATEVEKKRIEGDTYFKADNYDGALKDYQTILTYEPDNDEIKDKVALTKKILDRYNKGVDNFDSKNYADAIDYFKQMADLNPSSAIAEKYIKRATQEGKKQVKAWFSQGLEFMQNNELRRAKNRFASVLRADPNNSEAKKKLKEVEKMIAVALKSAYNTGLSAYNKKQYSKAIRAFNQVLALQDPYKDAFALKQKALRYNDKSRAEAEKRKKAKAQEYMADGIKLYRDDKLKEAIKSWEKVLDLFPNDAQAKKYIARAKYKLQQLNK